MKVHYYRAITNYQMAAQAESDQEHGKRLAYATVAVKELESATKLAKKEEQFAATLQFARDVMVGV